MHDTPPSAEPEAEDKSQGSEAMAFVRELKEASKRISPRTIGIGAAVGIGSAAIVAALLYARTNGRKPGRK